MPQGRSSVDGTFKLCSGCKGPYRPIGVDTGFCPECLREVKGGKTALEIQAGGRAATVETSDAQIEGNQADLITTLRQDLAVIEGGMLQGEGLRMRGAEFAARAMRLRQLIDRDTGGE